MKPKNLIIRLEEVHFYARHGVFSQETHVGADFIVNLEIRIPALTEESDLLESTISYGDLYEEVKAEMQEPAGLLETLCMRIAERLERNWPFIESGSIKIKKVAPPIAGIRGDCSVELTF